MMNCISHRLQPYRGTVNFIWAQLYTVLEASQERPYLSLRLSLAPTLVGEVMVEAGHASPRDSADTRAIAVSPLDANLLDASVRLTRLLDAPAEARVLGPLITREIIYRLLVGEQGTRLRGNVSFAKGWEKRRKS